MASTVAASVRFDMGRVVGRTFSAVGRNFVLFFALGVVFAGAPALMVAVGQDLSAVERGNPLEGYTPVYFSGLLLSVVGTYILQAALTHGAVMHFNGRPASLGDCIATGVRFVLPVFAIALVASLGIFAGLLLLIVPGLFLMAAWAVIVPAEVVERTGVFGAFSRSGDLTRNHRWAIFLLGLALVVLSFIFQMITGALAGIVAISGTISAGSAIGIASLVSAPVVAIIGAVGVASLYYELRSVKEGVGADQLAAVFD